MRRRIKIKRWIKKKFFQQTQLALYFVALAVAFSFSIWDQGQNMSLRVVEATEVIVPKADSLKTNEEIVREIAEMRGFKDTENLLKVLQAESGMRQYALNNNGDSIDRGIAQFNSKWRPDVSNACAFDTACAVNEMISTVNIRGGYDRWYGSYNLDLN